MVLPAAFKAEHGYMYITQGKNSGWITVLVLSLPSRICMPSYASANMGVRYY